MFFMPLISDARVITDICSGLDLFTTRILRKLHSPDPDIATTLYRNQPSLFSNLLSVLFEIVMSEHQHQWTLSQPLLPLILLNRSQFDSICEKQLGFYSASAVTTLKETVDATFTADHKIDVQVRANFTNAIAALQKT